MKKFGFTLAEVLITLGIIGVVAALTAPSLVLSSRNEANAARLAVNVSNLENAFSNAMIKENVETLSNLSWMTGNDQAALAGHLGQYLQTMGHKNENVAVYYGGNFDNKPGEETTSKGTNGPYDINGNAYETGQIFSTAEPILLKNGAAVFINNTTSGADQKQDYIKDLIINNGGSLLKRVATVVIDINGTDQPNRLGRDIFVFYLSDNGTLYPFGGLDVALYDENGNKDPAQQKLWTAHSGCTSSNMGYGDKCTARVIEEGYKMNY